MNRLLLISLAIIFSVFAIYVWFVSPALNGSFELDDYSNLEKLSQISSYKDIVKFSFDGIASKLGRPVSLISFALQYSAWPVPYNFKLVNLLLHLINSLLVFCLVYQLVNQWVDKRKKALLIALISSIFWLFSPIHIYSVFYVVQRMTLLSAFFVLLGANFYIYIRLKIIAENFKKGIVLLTVSYLACLLLGVLSKENAILLSCFLLLIEAVAISFLTNNRNIPSEKHTLKIWSGWKIVFLWMPIILLTAYLAFTGHFVYERSNVVVRFNSLERLYTQSHVILDYIQAIMFPEFGKYGLVTDDYPISRGNIPSWSTLGLIITYVFLLFFTWIKRKKFPVITFGVYWFFTGHLLESTVLPLEIYFDHRNYLPALGVYLVIAYGIVEGGYYLKSFWLKGFLLISGVIYWLSLVFVLSAEANVWSSQQKLIVHQIKYHPHSLRARMSVMNWFGNNGQIKKAALLLKEINKEYPDMVGNQIRLLLMSCLDASVISNEKRMDTSLFEKGRYDHGISDSLNQIFHLLKENRCKGINNNYFIEVLSSLQKNNSVNNRIAVNLATLKARSYALDSKWSDAIYELDNIDEKYKNIDVYLLTLDYQLLGGDKEGAKNTIAKIESIIHNNLLYNEVYADYITSIKSQLLKSK